MLNSVLHVSGERNLLFQNFILFFHISFKHLTSAKPTVCHSDINQFCTQLHLCGFIPVAYLYLRRYSLYCCHYDVMYSSKYLQRGASDGREGMTVDVLQRQTAKKL